MSNTGQAAAVSSSSATLSIDRHGLKGGGRDGIAEDILRPRQHRGRCHPYIGRDQANVAAFTGVKHQAARPERHRPMIAIACSVTDAKRDQ